MIGGKARYITPENHEPCRVFVDQVEILEVSKVDTLTGEVEVLSHFSVDNEAVTYVIKAKDNILITPSTDEYEGDFVLVWGEVNGNAGLQGVVIGVRDKGFSKVMIPFFRERSQNDHFCREKFWVNAVRLRSTWQNQ